MAADGWRAQPMVRKLHLRSLHEDVIRTTSKRRGYPHVHFLERIANRIWLKLDASVMQYSVVWENTLKALTR